MEFILEKASDWNFSDKIEINNLEQLMNFIKENGDIVIDNNRIIIYDYYLE